VSQRREKAKMNREREKKIDREKEIEREKYKKRGRES
jgi:hypothetical protein